MRNKFYSSKNIVQEKSIFNYFKYSYLNNYFVRKKIKLTELADIIINDMYIKRNDVVMVHTSFDQINLVDSKPEDLIFLLKMIVGTSGTILVPAFSISRSKFLKFQMQTHNYNRVCQTDGIIEQFNQMPETFTVSSGTESFAVWGSMAKDIAESPCKDDTSIGDSKILYLLCMLKAKIIGLGVSLTDMSFPDFLSETTDVESTRKYPDLIKGKPDHSDWENIPLHYPHSLSNLLKTKYPDDPFKLYEKDELNLFKKKGISFFLIDAGKLCSKSIV